MRTKLSILLTITMILALIPMSAFALEPVDPNELMMYADDVTFGNALTINISNYTAYHHLRLDPANALGEFDAIQTDGGMANAKFFGLAAREWTEYTFEERFCNVDWDTDIQFAEVTWGSANGWHPEAAKVYLTGAIVDGELKAEPYYVGIVWNRIGVNYISAADRLAIAKTYSPDVNRELATSELQTEGVIEITGFNLPAQVESAAGIKLIDITKDIYNKPTTSSVAVSTYTNGAGGRFTVNYLPLVYPNVGAVTITSINPAGNTDGFDLDAIRVWKCVPIEEEYGFCGYKLNAETGEGLEDWIIILRDDSGKEIDRTTTNANGRYCFDGLLEGTYTVEEVLENGWEQVFPGGNGKHVVTLPDAGVNLIVNGDFEAGNTGFISDYDFVAAEGTTGGNDGLGTLDREGAYAIGTDPARYHALWESFGDHTSGTGKMMIVNGEEFATGKIVWSASVNVVADTDYTFSFWGATSYPAAYSSLDVYINDEYIDTYDAPELLAEWTKFATSWSSGINEEADIKLICNTLVHTGNDFALDDISLTGKPLYNFENMEEEEFFDLCGFKYGLDYVGFMDDPWPTDRPLEGWTIILERYEDDEWVEVDRDTTNAIGKYCFLDLPAGDYRLSEEVADEKDGFWMMNGKYWLQVGPEGKYIFASLSEDETSLDFFNLCYTSETAWMFGDTSHIGLTGLRSNNWGWSMPLGIIDKGEESIMTDVPIYAAAGQNDTNKGYLVGYVDISWDEVEEEFVIVVDANEDVYLEDMKVWIGNTPLPKTKKGAYTNAPGQLIVDPKLDLTKEVFLAIHFEAYVPCEYSHPEME